MKNKKIIIPIVVSLLVVVLLAGISYAYYSANVKEVNQTETVIKTNELNIVFTGTNEINVDGIVPGDSFTKTFTVENTSNVEVTYNIFMEKIINEFNEDLVYTLSDEEGTVITEEVLPSTNSGKNYLITDISIDSKEIKTYTMKVEFKYSDEDQNKLQGASFKATLGVDTTLIKIVKVVNDKLELDTLNSGDTVTKTFSVKNLSSVAHSYDIKLSDVANTYASGLTYSLSKNGEEVISNAEMPASDSVILENQIINANTKDEYEMTIKYDNTTEVATVLCKRATELHTEICNQNDTNNYCSGAGYDQGAIIKYGNETITKGFLNPGDAFDCDIDGDRKYGEYDETTGKYTERFYYVADANNGITSDSNVAVLIYYKNVSGGVPNNTDAFLYSSSGSNINGPLTAVEQLPTTTQWSNIHLINSTRNLTGQAGNLIVSGFNYENKAARLLTAQELNEACKITVGSATYKELDGCKYLMENTKYSNDALVQGYWLENPRTSYANYCWVANGKGRHVSSSGLDGTAGVRPVIEVYKEDIEI